MSIVSTLTKSGPFAFTVSPQVIPTGFSFQSQADLLVLDYGPTLGTNDPATVLVLGSDYTCSGGGYNSANEMQTGSITVVSGGMSNVQVGDNLIIMRNAPLNQLSSFRATGPLTAALLEQMGDKLATLSQQVNELGQRSLHFENFETQNGLLNFTARAGKLIGFDTSGNLQFSSDSSGSGTTYTAGPGLILASNQFSVDPSQSLTDLTVTNPIVGYLAGNASTATTLQTARTINGVSFDGSTDIVVTAAAGTLTGSALNATVTSAPGLLSASIGVFGSMAIQSSSAVAITGGTITGMPTPTNAADVANKSYVDTHASGIVQRAGVQVATTANVTLSGEQTIDGVLTSTSRILVKNQTLSQNNGIYVTAAGAWSRATDSDTAAELLVGYYYFVSLGTTQGSTGWTIQTAPTILGTDPIVFGQFSASTTYTAGSGLTLVGNVFTINAAQPTVTSLGTLTSLTTSGQITSTVSTGVSPLVIASTTNVPNLNASSLNGATFAAPGSIGSGTPGPITSTTLISSSGITILASSSLNMTSGVIQCAAGNNLVFNAPSGNQIDFKINSVPIGALSATGFQGPIGATTPSTGAFTTLSGSFTSTGSVTSRSLAARGADVINAKDYGAVPNTGTDQTSALQAWLNAAINSCTLYLPAGIYHHTGLSVPASKTQVAIMGNGAELYQDTNANNSLVIPSTCSYVTIDGIWFNGVGTSRANGIHLRINSDYTKVQNCRFEACSDWAIQVDGTVAVKGFVCTNNLFINTLGDGCHVMNVDGFRIQNNTFWQCGDDAIAALAQSATVQPLNGIIEDNLIYGRTTAIAGANTHGFRGIVVMIGKNITIRGNHIYNTYAAAIDVNDEYNSSLFNEGITVENNHCSGCNVNGGPLGTIQMYFANKCTLSTNHIYDMVNASGISLAACSTVSLVGNEISQSLNQFARGIVNDNDASYIGRTITASNDIQILSNTFDFTQASNNEAVYLQFTTGARCNNLLVAGNTSRSTAISYINCDWIITGKFVNNTTIGGTAAPATGSNSTSITSTNNN